MNAIPNPVATTVSADELRELEHIRMLLGQASTMVVGGQDCYVIHPEIDNKRFIRIIDVLGAALRQGRQGVSEVVGWQVRERNAEGWSMWSYTSKETATMFRSDPARYSWVEVRDLVVAPMLAQGKDAQAVGIGDWARTQATMHAHHATPIQPTSAPSAIPAGHLTELVDAKFVAVFNEAYDAAYSEFWPTFVETKSDDGSLAAHRFALTKALKAALSAQPVAKEQAPHD